MTIEFYDEKTHEYVKPPMTTYGACGIVEGFDGEEHTEDEQLDAWQHLIDTGICWVLQGWYGRNAAALIEQGLCKPANREGR